GRLDGYRLAIDGREGVVGLGSAPRQLRWSIAVGATRQTAAAAVRSIPSIRHIGAGACRLRLNGIGGEVETGTASARGGQGGTVVKAFGDRSIDRACYGRAGILRHGLGCNDLQGP